ncbi:MAG TPA: type II toxin-antitoxin system RelE/ParE family toxin [Halomonas sp.]|nr:type II toxin-antitoxin system RelE/ParE family toxin [Halomonas sp.]
MQQYQPATRLIKTYVISRAVDAESRQAGQESAQARPRQDRCQHRRVKDWPGCITVKDIKPLKRHQYQYRLRVGRYRVLFDVETGLRVVSIEEVRKRDERTY